MNSAKQNLSCRLPHSRTCSSHPLIRPKSTRTWTTTRSMISSVREEEEYEAEIDENEPAHGRNRWNAVRYSSDSPGSRRNAGGKTIAATKRRKRSG